MLKSKAARLALMVGGAIIVLLVVFGFGMYIGEKKEAFEYKWGENYGRFFGEPKKGFFPVPIGSAQMSPRGGMNAFGNGGIVLKINGNMLAIEGYDGDEKVVAVASSTVIRELNGNIALNAIKPGDAIVVIGDPNNNGQIQARFIRVFPSQNKSGNQTSTIK
jgi:hypothetical protein